jgi:hypothetical protein
MGMSVSLLKFDGSPQSSPRVASRPLQIDSWSHRAIESLNDCIASPPRGSALQRENDLMNQRLNHPMARRFPTRLDSATFCSFIEGVFFLLALPTGDLYRRYPLPFSTSIFNAKCCSLRGFGPSESVKAPGVKKADALHVAVESDAVLALSRPTQNH